VTVAIIGAGLAGLACANELRAAGVDVTVYEASDGVGGRVRSDVVDGFTLDRGFQVALTAYPEMHRQLDMDALDLQAFDPGALVWRDGKGSVVADPFRMPRGVAVGMQAAAAHRLEGRPFG
jgi:phytoene dehydrogenase-like protein